MADDDAGSIGAPIGKYRLVSQIGQGGFATVFLAADEQGNEVAIKQFSRQYNEDGTENSVALA